MTIIRVRCTDQVLTFENTPVIASGGLGEDFIAFTFCSKWDGLEKTAVFWKSEAEAYHNLLDADNSCPIPPEVLTDEGVIYFGVFGVDPAGKQRTSEVLSYRIVKGAITEGTAPSDPTPDIYTQLLTQYASIVSMYASKADKVTGATAGNFATLDAEGNLKDSGKHVTSFLRVVVGPEVPEVGEPVLWFNDAGSLEASAAVVMLDLEEGDDGEVQAELDGESYNVENGTVNTEPTESGVVDIETIDETGGEGDE